MKKYIHIIKNVFLVFSFVSIGISLYCLFTNKFEGKMLISFMIFMIGYSSYILHDGIRFIEIYIKKNNKIRLITFSIKHIILSLIIGGVKLFYPYNVYIQTEIIIFVFIQLIFLFFVTDLMKLIGHAKYENNSRESRDIIKFSIKYILIIFIVMMCVDNNIYKGIIFTLKNPERIILQSSNRAKLKINIEEDLLRMNAYITGLNKTMDNIESNSDLFKKKYSEITWEERKLITEMWASVSCYTESIDKILDKHYMNYIINIENPQDIDIKSFIIRYAGNRAKTINGIKLMNLVENNSEIQYILNEENDKHFIPQNAYYSFKIDVIDNLCVHKEEYFKENYKYIFSNYNNAESDYKAISLMNYIDNNPISEEQLLIDHSNMYMNKAFSKINNITTNLWNPIQKRLLIAVTGVEYGSRKEKLISDTKIETIKEKLEPGDILLKRANWQLTNFGIPGFWTHSGIYIGKMEEIDEYFSDIELLNGTIPSEYIKNNYPKVYKRVMNNDNDIIESVADGVVINPLENIAKVDYFVSLRPNLSKQDKFKALIRAFDFYNKPYDYSFNFLTDNELICSELVYKAYLPDKHKLGLNFKFSEVNGLPMISPNDIAKKFDDEYGKDNQELSCVIFYDGSERRKLAFESNPEEFRSTWKRSRWDFIRQ